MRRIITELFTGRSEDQPTQHTLMGKEEEVDSDTKSKKKKEQLLLFQISDEVSEYQCAQEKCLQFR